MKCHFHITSYLTELCVFLMTFLERGHFVMLMRKSMHLINLHFWTYLVGEPKQITSTGNLYLFFTHKRMADERLAPNPLNKEQSCGTEKFKTLLA